MRSLVILRDLTRPQEVKRVYSWLSGLARALAPAFKVYDHFDIFETKRIYDEIGCAFTNQSWANLFSNGHPVINARLDQYAEKGVIVGYEIAPSIENYLRIKNYPYLNFALNPIRFLPDIYFSISTNIETLEAFNSCHVVADQEIRAHAGVLRAAFLSKKERKTDRFQNIFIGQTEVDRSLIADGRFHTIEEYKDRLPCDIHVKVHPLSKSKPSFGRSIVKENIYKLLSENDDLKVYALSSSVLVEAPFFGCEAFRLLPGSNEFPRPPLRHPYFMQGFWRAIFEPRDPETIEFPANYLRLTLDLFYGYQGLFESVEQKLLHSALLKANSNPKFWRDLVRATFRRAFRLE